MFKACNEIFKKVFSSDLQARDKCLSKIITALAIAWLAETILLFGFILASYHISQVWTLTTIGLWSIISMLLFIASNCRKNPPNEQSIVPSKPEA